VNLMPGREAAAAPVDNLLEILPRSIVQVLG